MAPIPVLVIVLCGKRKCGKDYFAARLQELLGDSVSVLHLSKPLKEQYAKEHDLNAARLMDSSGYKETYRKDMIRWGEEKRASDSGYFCRLAAEDADGPVWLVCDARRPTDMEYFQHLYCCTTVRVVAGEGVRKARGWEWVEGVDNAPSECALDGYPCDQTVRNDGDEKQLAEELEKIRKLVAGRTR